MPAGVCPSATRACEQAAARVDHPAGPRRTRAPEILVCWDPPNPCPAARLSTNPIPPPDRRDSSRAHAVMPALLPASPHTACVFEARAGFGATSRTDSLISKLQLIRFFSSLRGHAAPLSQHARRRRARRRCGAARTVSPSSAGGNAADFSAAHTEPCATAPPAPAARGRRQPMRVRAARVACCGMTRPYAAGNPAAAAPRLHTSRPLPCTC